MFQEQMSNESTKAHHKFNISQINNENCVKFIRS
jgi:hypothetical protein